MEGNLVYLFAALALTWIVIVGYLLVLGGRLTGLQRELESLRRQSDWSDDTSDDTTRDTQP
jgi:CcmD family protein